MYNVFEKNNKEHIIKAEYLIYFLYFGMFLLVGLSMVFKQPFGNPPDEYNRYLIPRYICKYGTLPNGFDEEIRIPGYGFSYGFQPILPYIFQGYAMRLVNLFTASESVLLYTARLTDLILGLIMSYIVLLLGKELFADRRLSWFFSFLVTFLPQSIFVHTYVNTDSCCMLSISIILYATVLCYKNNYRLRSSLLLAVGIILCALSYYNAYAYILSAILLFTAYFIKAEKRDGRTKLHFEFNMFIKKGLIIAIPVLLGIGWWFIRSACLYDGDFLGLRTRNYCGSLYAIPEFDPANMNTYLKEGKSIWYMLTHSSFITLTGLSFIGIYGPMTIVSTIWLYRFYKVLFFTGIFAELLWIVARIKISYNTKKPVLLRLFVHANMLFCIFMPIALSVWYSYATDYQPQGRYILPALIPVCYYCCAGFEKIVNLINKKMLKGYVITYVLAALIIAAILILLLVTVYGYAFPYYTANPIAS